MKTIHTYFIAIGLLLISCSKPEPGTIELEILSKKVFDVMKGGDEAKFQLLIPDEVSFKLYSELIKKDSGHALDGIGIFDADLISQFKNFRNELHEIGGATHSNYTEELSKTKNMTKALVTTKFTIDGNVTKYQFDAVKLNGRWFCLGNFMMIQPNETN